MSYIIRSGNLTHAPTLRTSEDGRSYCFARVAVNDRARSDSGEWETVGTTFYDVTVGGNDATRLVELAEESGNIRILFAGRYQVREYTRKDGSLGIAHRVQADEIGVSLRGQNIQVSTPNAAPSTPPDEDDEWREYAAF